MSLWDREYAIPVEVIEKEMVSSPVYVWAATDSFIFPPIPGYRVLIRNMSLQIEKTVHTGLCYAMIYTDPPNGNQLKDALIITGLDSIGKSSAILRGPILLERNQGFRLENQGPDALTIVRTVLYQKVQDYDR
jgi:hypothetical protein